MSDLPHEPARQAHQQLLRWLLHDALPLWAEHGFDAIHGGFFERLDGNAAPSHEPRRIRVQTRQIYCFAQASRLGWHGDASGLVRAGLDYLLHHYRRSDGLYRNLIDVDGRVLQECATLYEQAFVLLALAESEHVLGVQPALRAEARQVRSAITRQLSWSSGGFASGTQDPTPLLSNPHMHLLEATLSWRALDDEPAWAQLEQQVLELALEHFIDPDSGALYEEFDGEWAALGPRAQRRVEPGHQFEWAWLLMRCSQRDTERVRRCVARLLQIGEQHGVHRGVVRNALDGTLALADAQARLWPQTERLKASARHARCSDAAPDWQHAVQAAQTLLRYLQMAPRGLWFDRLNAQDDFVAEPAPASNFYHIICAIDELGAMLNGL